MLPKLKDAITENVNPRNAQSVLKYIEKAQISTWKNLDKPHLMRFAKEVKGSVCSSSAHTIFAVFKAFLGKFEEDLDLPKGWRKLMNAKEVLPMKTYLTAEEVEAFGAARVDSEMEQTVREGFYLSCKTGLRHSDLMKLLPSNFQPMEGGGWVLNYVSKKTKIHSTVPCSDATKAKAEWLHANGVQTSLTYYNDTVRELAKRAGIDSEVVVFGHDEEFSGPKYTFLSSHSARISFCTVLSDKHMDVTDISKMAGHKDPMTTLRRYIVSRKVELTQSALEFLM